jgi:hypothetical protein
VTTERLKLSDKQPFGIGGRRLCFEHPHDPAKCVKVLRTDPGRTIRVKGSRSVIPAHLRRTYDNNRDEQRVLEDLYRRLGPRMAAHLPICHGQIQTDLGPGLVLDLYRDPDGRISRNLRDLIMAGHELETFRPAFDRFAQFLMDNLVLTRALLDHNLVVQARGGDAWHMYLIDGVGDRAWLPLSSWFTRIGRITVAKRTAEAWPRFMKTVGERRALVSADDAAAR